VVHRRLWRAPNAAPESGEHSSKLHFDSGFAAAPSWRALGALHCLGQRRGPRISLSIATEVQDAPLCCVGFLKGPSQLMIQDRRAWP